MQTVKGVVFDFGGVMTTSTMPERVRTCVAELGIDWAQLESGFARYRHLLDGGFLTLDQMYDLIWADADIRLPPAMRERVLREDFASFLTEYRNERTLAWMRSLKSAGYRIGILTNMPPEFAPKFKVAFADFIATADAMVISGEEHMFKPQRRIYELLQARLALPPEALCFVDDVATNCDAARQLGWQAVQFVSNAQAEGDFARLN